MPIEPVIATPSPLEPRKRELRTAVLCLPSWIPFLWALLLVILQAIKPAYAHSYLRFKPLLYVASISSIIAPLCWIGALIGVLRNRPATRFQMIVLTSSPFIIAATWFALYHYGRH